MYVKEKMRFAMRTPGDAVSKRYVNTARPEDAGRRRFAAA
jgi:hypothetical protein